MPLIIHPEFKKLKDELSKLIFEHEELVNQICPHIERNYVIQFGFLEFTLYKKELEVDRLKMKIKLIQKEINNQNEVDLENIDQILKRKFKDYEEKLKQSMDELNQKVAEKELFSELSSKDAKKLKIVYKRLVKKLHPDLNPDQTDFEKTLFVKANSAFQMGDLEELEAIDLMLPTNEEDDDTDFDKLKELIGIYEKKIEDIKQDYPYNKLELIENKEKSIEYVNMLNDLIDSKTEEIKILNDKIDELI